MGGRIRASAQRDVAHIVGPPKRRRFSAPRPYLSFRYLATMQSTKTNVNRPVPSDRPFEGRAFQNVGLRPVPCLRYLTLHLTAARFDRTR
ncbi:hypothetical protein AM571_PA00150 (plasmid) [Rhizobium etli 8C-3]|uniref:Uncharacterized protein n=1 Tax=Rhizobium etli 8C-3 TaxID=538025 RepID=A0A1L5PAA7_RHIET|nr:hypothetical protein AM571_PA00150 [Rhizobium etli 8C-3]